MLVILIGRGMAQFHYPRGNPFMLLRILSMNAGKLQQIQTHARAIAALLYDETAPEQLTTTMKPFPCQAGFGRFRVEGWLIEGERD
jgi:hypothetical protein